MKCAALRSNFARKCLFPFLALVMTCHDDGSFCLLLYGSIAPPVIMLRPGVTRRERGRHAALQLKHITISLSLSLYIYMREEEKHFKFNAW